ncbi:MAG: MOSC domain-containing protein [Candidatus Eisenbacteria bacterium]|uniref:MOSC domain-containing protein n=1 Tax=Eiseniibacteriota bacterium TaxID=2212470 RepID=A0A7Y2H0R6_UNCEI|nr:MOSC domain-containing protein [Candidatus Eisenbacteria bacterium]
MAGQLEKIWTKRAHAGVMDEQSEGELVVDKGLVNNVNQGGKRAITVISKERWAEAEAMLDQTIDPKTRRANLLVSGISLLDSRNMILTIGETKIKLMGETRPCELMDKFVPGLRNALAKDWGGGAYGVVIEGGAIRVGDKVEIYDSETVTA